MDSLTERDFELYAEQAFTFVFAAYNPFDQPFRAEIQHRLLLFGFRYGLHPPWLEPIAKAIEKMGEDGFYVTVLSRPKAAEQDQSYHWYVPLNEADIYRSKVFPLENAIYSVHGRWGLICSHEDHALVGGPTILIDSISASVEDLDRRVQDFLDTWKHHYDQNKVDIGWIPEVLSHIYGTSQMKQILQQSELKWLITKWER